MVRTNHVTADRNINWRARSREAYYGFGRAYACISWGGIFAGAVVAIATQLVLALIGGAICLATFCSPTGAASSRRPRWVGRAVSVGINRVVLLFAVGEVACRL